VIFLLLTYQNRALSDIGGKDGFSPVILAGQIGFDERPVFPASYRYLEERGVAIVRGVQREETRAVLTAYATGGGLIHNRQD